MIESLQAWLAVEHEAVWLYGLIGGRFDDLSADAREAWNRHRDARDRLIGVIAAAEGESIGPRLTYRSDRLDSKSAARTAAQELETRVCAAALGAVTDGEQRPDSVAALRDAATAAVTWGATPSAFPGLS